jgi:hypothetical protein
MTSPRTLVDGKDDDTMIVKTKILNNIKDNIKYYLLFKIDNIIGILFSKDENVFFY